jgi:hypothetical protein
VSFLLSGATVKESLLEAFNSKKLLISADIGSGRTVAIAVVSVGVLVVVVMGCIILYWVRRLNW